MRGFARESMCIRVIARAYVRTCTRARRSSAELTITSERVGVAHIPCCDDLCFNCAMAHTNGSLHNAVAIPFEAHGSDCCENAEGPTSRTNSGLGACSRVRRSKVRPEHYHIATGGMQPYVSDLRSVWSVQTNFSFGSCATFDGVPEVVAVDAGGKRCAA